MDLELQQEPETAENRINRAIKAHQDREKQLIGMLEGKENVSQKNKKTNGTF